MGDILQMKTIEKKSDDRENYKCRKIVLSIACAILVYIMANTISICVFSQKDQTCNADVAIILGAATQNNEVSPVYRERINQGIRLYQEGDVKKIIVTGGTGEGNNKSDAYIAKQYVVSKGIPEADILTEETSTITQENLEYSKVIMDANNYETALIVSDPLHMKRAMLLAEDAGIIAYSSPTTTTKYESLKTKIPFLAREVFFYVGYKWYRLFSGKVAVVGTVDEKSTEVEQKETKKMLVGADFTSGLYPNANSRMVYIEGEDNTLEQWALDGTYKQTITMPAEEFSGLSLLWISDNEILWNSEDEDGEKELIQSTPIRQTETGEEFVFEETKTLFSVPEFEEPNGAEPLFGVGKVYADEEKIIYLSFAGNLYMYDRKSGEKPIVIEDGYTSFSKYATSLAAMRCGNYMIYHTGRESGKREEDTYGFWSYSIKEQKSKLIDSRCFSDAAYVADTKNNKVYYQIIRDQSIWEYDCQTGEKKELISESQLKECYEANGLSWDDAYFNDSLFVDGDCLYFVKNQKQPQIFSYSLQEGSIVYKKELTEKVEKSGYANIGNAIQFLYILEGKVLLYQDDEDSEHYICIDIQNAESKAVTEDDPEKIYFGLFGMWANPDMTAEWEETEINPSESSESEMKSLSVKEQIALIASYSDVWKDYLESGNRNFAITDLDHNGRLEMIVSSGTQGSGFFTSSYIYQVSADGKSLHESVSSEFSSEFDSADIVNGIDTVYVDSETDTYYYLADNYTSGGAGIRYMWYGALVFKNGYFTSRTYAGKDTEWNAKENEEIWHYYQHIDGKEKEVSANKFDEEKLADEFFKGFKKKSVNISWFKMKKKMTKKDMKKAIKKSYEEFR